MYKSFFKRIFDIIVSGTLLIMLSPVLLYLAYSIKKNLGSPIIFTQVRPGKDGKLFRMCKFRSMTTRKAIFCPMKTGCRLLEKNCANLPLTNCRNFGIFSRAI